METTTISTTPPVTPFSIMDILTKKESKEEIGQSRSHIAGVLGMPGRRDMMSCGSPVEAFAVEGGNSRRNSRQGSPVDQEGSHTALGGGISSSNSAFVNAEKVGFEMGILQDDNQTQSSMSDEEDEGSDYIDIVDDADDNGSSQPTRITRQIEEGTFMEYICKTFLF